MLEVSILNQLSIPHVDNAIRNGSRFGIMRDHQNCLSQRAIQRSHHVQDSLGILAVQIPRRLISQQNLGFADDGACNCHPLLFAPGKGVGAMVQPVGDAEHFHDHLKTMRIEAVAMNMLSQLNILLGCERGEQVEALKDKANFMPPEASPLAIRHIAEVISFNPNLATVGEARPPRRCNNVDLPQPEGPTIATNSPSWIASVTPRSACVSTLPVR